MSLEELRYLVNPVDVFPGWAPGKLGLLDLLFGWLSGARQRAVASFTLLPEGMSLTFVGDGTEPAVVSFDAPFVVKLSHWPYKGEGCELNLSLRQRGAGASSPWLNLRIMWPKSAIEGSVPTKQELFPFIDPALLPMIWRCVGAHAAAHGTSMPRGLDVEGVASSLYRSLRSEGAPPRCVACGSLAVEVVGSQRYRCRACTYHGGAGWGPAPAKREQVLAAMDWPTRVTLAMSNLEEARMLVLVSGVGALVETQDTQVAARLIGARNLVRDARAASPKKCPGLEQAWVELRLLGGSTEDIMRRASERRLKNIILLIDRALSELAQL